MTAVIGGRARADALRDIDESPVAHEDTASAARLRGLIAASRTIRAGSELPEVLADSARTIAESLGFGSVGIALYRHAWDDFAVSCVHGGERAGEALAAFSHGGDATELALAELPERRGVHVADEAWLAPLRHADGHLLGVVAAAEQRDDGAHTDEALDVLVAIAEHAAIAVEREREAATELRHRLALAQLLAVSSWLSGASSIDLILPAVCHAIRDTLGFLRVSIELADALTGRLETRATVGASPDASGLTVAALEPLLEPRFEIEGCYLVPPDAGVLKPAQASTRDGRGPWAWHDHWLVVPLYDRNGALVGAIQADDPSDRLLPDQERLQALRVFANQTTAAVLAAAQLDELRFLADHDPLTRLLNRRAFIRQLESEVAGAERHGRLFSLVLCDLDGFKALNDRWGHAVGDEALRTLGRILCDALRRNDGAFRIGGDEFALLLQEASDEGAEEVIARISDLLADAAEDERLAGLQASFGVAACPGSARDAQALFRVADEALYRAKRTGAGSHYAA